MVTRVTLSGHCMPGLMQNTHITLSPCRRALCPVSHMTHLSSEIKPCWPGWNGGRAHLLTQAQDRAVWRGRAGCSWEETGHVGELLAGTEWWPGVLGARKGIISVTSKVQDKVRGREVPAHHSYTRR
jgi:hypothetical protein